MGLYPIVTDIPANRAWIDPGVNGDLFPVGDDQALAGALTSAISATEVRAQAVDRNLTFVRRDLAYETNMRRIEAAIWRCAGRSVEVGR